MNANIKYLNDVNIDKIVIKDSCFTKRLNIEYIELQYQAIKFDHEKYLDYIEEDEEIIEKLIACFKERYFSYYTHYGMLKRKIYKLDINNEYCNFINKLRNINKNFLK